MGSHLLQGVSGIAWLPHRPLPAFVTCGGDGLLLWSLTPNFLEQRQLDIPDIALAVNAAAGGGSGGGTDGSGSHGSTAQSLSGCQITAVCTAASGGGGCDIDSLAVAAGDGAADPVWQRQQREAAAVTVFAADSAGAVWQLALGEGRLCGCIKVTSLPAGEWATSLQWSQPAGALAVGTSRGCLLRFTCSCSSRVGVDKGTGVSSGVDAAVTPTQAAAQWWSAAAGSSAAWTASALPSWTRCTPGSSGSSGGCASQQQPLQLDGPVVQLCLEPHALCEGVVTAGGATAWYISLESQQKAPLLAGHSGQVTALLPVASGSQEGSLVASLGQDGRLAVWQTAAASSSSSRGMAQVLVTEWACADAPPTAAVFLEEQSACVLGHADGRLALLKLPTLSDSSSSRVLPRGQVDGGCGRSGAGVLRWCVVRQPSAVVGLAVRPSVHPDQPLVMAASRCRRVPVVFVPPQCVCSIDTANLCLIHLCATVRQLPVGVSCMSGVFTLALLFVACCVPPHTQGRPDHHHPHRQRLPGGHLQGPHRHHHTPARIRSQLLTSSSSRHRSSQQQLRGCRGLVGQTAGVQGTLAGG